MIHSIIGARKTIFHTNMIETILGLILALMMGFLFCLLVGGVIYGTIFPKVYLIRHILSRADNWRVAKVPHFLGTPMTTRLYSAWGPWKNEKEANDILTVYRKFPHLFWNR